MCGRGEDQAFKTKRLRPSAAKVPEHAQKENDHKTTFQIPSIKGTKKVAFVVIACQSAFQVE